VNVALGGNLYQDIILQIPETLEHSASRKGKKVFHYVDISENSLLFRIYGTGKIRVRSAHHQSVKILEQDCASQRKPRHVIEALELRSNAFLSPYNGIRKKMPYDQYTKKLLKAFINASKKQ